VVYTYDIMGSREELDYKQWVLFCMVEIIASVYALHYHFHYFNSEEKGHLIFGFLYMNMIFVGVAMSIFDAQEIKKRFLENDIAMLIIFFVFVQMLSLHMSISESVHNDHIQQIFEHLSDQEFLKVVLNNQTESMIILNDKCRITYSNSPFKELFDRAISFS